MKRILFLFIIIANLLYSNASLQRTLCWFANRNGRYGDTCTSKCPCQSDLNLECLSGTCG
jgi:hypothetical protein